MVSALCALLHMGGHTSAHCGNLESLGILVAVDYMQRLLDVYINYEQISVPLGSYRLGISINRSNGMVWFSTTAVSTEHRYTFDLAERADRKKNSLTHQIRREPASHGVFADGSWLDEL